MLSQTVLIAQPTTIVPTLEPHLSRQELTIATQDSPVKPVALTPEPLSVLRDPSAQQIPQRPLLSVIGLLANTKTLKDKLAAILLHQDTSSLTICHKHVVNLRTSVKVTTVQAALFPPE